MPVAESVVARILCLPIHADLPAAMQAGIVAAIAGTATL
jgi:dTDP-4-amino-4,6-dideoxygalactose transaminase